MTTRCRQPEATAYDQHRVWHTPCISPLFLPQKEISDMSLDACNELLATADTGSVSSFLNF